jgi:glucosamine--fructose-6-phosphate aminotransferase (isomerizing)
MTDLAADLRSRGATSVGVGGDAGFAAACSAHVTGPDLPESLAPRAAIVPVQVLVERVTRRLGLDPDQPRGLAKVTMTDSHS